MPVFTGAIFTWPPSRAKTTSTGLTGAAGLPSVAFAGVAPGLGRRVVTLWIGTVSTPCRARVSISAEHALAKLGVELGHGAVDRRGDGRLREVVGRLVEGKLPLLDLVNRVLHPQPRDGQQSLEIGEGIRGDELLLEEVFIAFEIGLGL